MATRNQYSVEYKALVVLELLKEERTVAQISSEHSVHASMLHAWKAANVAGVVRHAEGLFDDHSYARLGPHRHTWLW